MKILFAVILAATLAGCTAVPDRSISMERVGDLDLCLCATATPPRADPAQCLAELSRRGSTCDPDYWSDYWARRHARVPSIGAAGSP